jgi:hypothetical protein
MYACLIRTGVSQSARYVLCKNLSGCFEEVLSSLFHTDLFSPLLFFLFLFLFFEGSGRRGEKKGGEREGERERV